MNQASDSDSTGTRKGRWIALGFVGAFAASVLTVIYTGLNVEGSRAEFDAGFRSVTMTVGDRREIELVFVADDEYPQAVLELTVPDAVRIGGQTASGPDGMALSLAAGRNEIPIEIVGAAPGSGYLTARVTADEPVGIYRLFVTVTAE